MFLLIRYGSKNLYILVSGVARRLLSEETRREAFASMQQLADIVGPKQFHSYIDKVSCCPQCNKTGVNHTTFDRIILDLDIKLCNR